VNLADMAQEMHRLSDLLDAGLATLRTVANELAATEAAYRKAKSEAWVNCPNDPPGVKSGEREWTAARREAWVDAAVADKRQARDLAEYMRTAALEAVRSRRTQISCLQTLMNADKVEAEFARTGPGLAA
jgi:hypothetical protein